MQKITIKEALCQKKYPGRGIFFGRSLDGKDIYIAYFIMGRSENSRNRILKADGLDIKTEAFNKEKMIKTPFGDKSERQIIMFV